ncbi:YvrJ-like protein OS=Ureibacillus acetophenoni OX=614649 GN=SAMN05877842_12134 PE=4 SV=1 [Ureibacillus acetophenoni]
MNFTGDQVAIIGSLFTIIPILLVALIIRWVRIIRVNSEIQIEQNKEIIALLKEINMKNEVQ